MNRSPACVSALVDPYTVYTDSRALSVVLFNAPPMRRLRQTVSAASKGGELDASDLDKPLEDSSEYVEGTRMMKRMETTK